VGVVDPVSVKTTFQVPVIDAGVTGVELLPAGDVLPAQPQINNMPAKPILVIRGKPFAAPRSDRIPNTFPRRFGRHKHTEIA
jgi:hypothetical protein